MYFIESIFGSKGTPPKDVIPIDGKSETTKKTEDLVKTCRPDIWRPVDGGDLLPWKGDTRPVFDTVFKSRTTNNK
jgi:hypothetical protein